MEIDKALTNFGNLPASRRRDRAKSFLFASTSWSSTSWGAVKCPRYYSKGLWENCF